MHIVTSLAEVWIEIWEFFHRSFSKKSLPSRKCGLKLRRNSRSRNHQVTFLAEVWIEIIGLLRLEYNHNVTSLAEVWIEIPHHNRNILFPLVTSLAEVWIEILFQAFYRAYT